MIFITPFGLYQPFGSQSGLPSALSARWRRRGDPKRLIVIAACQFPRLVAEEPLFDFFCYECPEGRVFTEGRHYDFGVVPDYSGNRRK